MSSLPKIECKKQKKGKMEDEEKVLNNKWTEEYFVVVETNNTASCLILRELYQFSTIAI